MERHKGHTIDAQRNPRDGKWDAFVGGAIQNTLGFDTEDEALEFARRHADLAPNSSGLMADEIVALNRLIKELEAENRKMRAALDWWHELAAQVATKTVNEF